MKTAILIFGIIMFILIVIRFVIFLIEENNEYKFNQKRLEEETQRNIELRKSLKEYQEIDNIIKKRNDSNLEYIFKFLDENKIPFNIIENATYEEIERFKNSIEKREIRTKELKEKYKLLTFDKTIF